MNNQKQDFFNNLSAIGLSQFKEEHFAVFASSHSTKNGSLQLGVVDGQFCVDTKDTRFSFDNPEDAIDKFKELYNQKSE